MSGSAHELSKKCSKRPAGMGCGQGKNCELRIKKEIIHEVRAFLGSFKEQAGTRPLINSGCSRILEGNQSLPTSISGLLYIVDRSTSMSTIEHKLSINR